MVESVNFFVNEFPHETYLVPIHEDEVILYAPLNGVVFLLNKTAASEWTKYIQNQSEKVPGFILEIQDILERNPAFYFPPFERDISYAPTHVSLAFSLGCTMRCSYCHAGAGTREVVMPWEMAKKAIDTGFQNSSGKKEDFLLSFAGGGEPTFEFNLFKQCTDYFHSLGPLEGAKKYLSMATNGYYHKDVSTYIRNTFSGVSLSLDGPPEIHNEFRKTLYGKGTFDTVFTNACSWFDEDFAFSIRATVSSRFVDAMDKIVLFFHEHFPGRTIGLEPLTPFGRGQNCAGGTPDAKDYVHNFKKVIDLGQELGIDIINSGTIKIDSLRPIFCKSVGNPGMVVTPEGHVSACERDNVPEQFYYGKWNNLTGDFDVDHEKIKYLRSFNANTIEECKHCFCKWHCAGDCLHLRMAGMNRCEVNRELLRYVLSKRIKDSYYKSEDINDNDRWNRKPF